MDAIIEFLYSNDHTEATNLEKVESVLGINKQKFY